MPCRRRAASFAQRQVALARRQRDRNHALSGVRQGRRDARFALSAQRQRGGTDTAWSKDRPDCGAGVPHCRPAGVRLRLHGQAVLERRHRGADGRGGRGKRASGAAAAPGVARRAARRHGARAEVPPSRRRAVAKAEPAAKPVEPAPPWIAPSPVAQAPPQPPRSFSRRPLSRRSQPSRRSPARTAAPPAPRAEPHRPRRSPAFPPVQPIGVATQSGPDAPPTQSRPVEREARGSQTEGQKPSARRPRMTVQDAKARKRPVRPAIYPLREFFAWRP